MQHRSNQKKYKNAAFTLLELSVVLLIIGLITGGVVMGKALIRSAQVKSVIEEYNHYVQAIGEFKEKYNSLPGDMTNAQTFWGVNPDCGSGGNPLTKQNATCNGNGDGMIGTSDNAGNYAQSGLEWFTAWQHLANSGFIEGLYTGAKGNDGTSDAEIGYNVPASALKPAGWSILYFQQAANSAQVFGSSGGYGSFGHILYFGLNGTNTPTINAVLAPDEALEIDRKIDDGRPNLGKVRAPRRGSSNAPICIATDVDPTTDKYNISYTLPACPLLFIPGL